jgi:hypothetical protein
MTVVKTGGSILSASTSPHLQSVQGPAAESAADAPLPNDWCPGTPGAKVTLRIQAV